MASRDMRRGLAVADGWRTLFLMVKEPRLGWVKTRLAREIGGPRALRFYRSSTANLVRRLRGDPRWRLVLAIAPDHAAASAFPAAGGVARMQQGTGDLGTRMQRLLDTAPPGPAIIIGSDIPDITTRHIADAFERLRDHDAVFGPAPDGGYWLVGLRRVPRVPRIFADVRWSGPHALSDTLANLSGFRVALAAELADVDDLASYTRLSAANCRLLARTCGSFATKG